MTSIEQQLANMTTQELIDKLKWMQFTEKEGHTLELCMDFQELCKRALLSSKDTTEHINAAIACLREAKPATLETALATIEIVARLLEKIKPSNEHYNINVDTTEFEKYSLGDSQDLL